MAEVEDTRRKNLQNVINRQYEGKTRLLAEKVGVQASYINRLFMDGKNKRAFTTQMARRIENGIGKPAGWLDENHKYVISYVHIHVPKKNSGNMVEILKSIPEVVEAAAIYGTTDVVARIEADSQERMDEVIMIEIQGFDVVNTTITYPVINREGMWWKR